MWHLCASEKIKYSRDGRVVIGRSSLLYVAFSLFACKAGKIEFPLNEIC